MEKSKLSWGAKHAADWEEERSLTRKEILAMPVSERPGKLRCVSNNDFTEEEIAALEAKYKMRIKRPCLSPNKL